MFHINDSTGLELATRHKISRSNGKEINAGDKDFNVAWMDVQLHLFGNAESQDRSLSNGRCPPATSLDLFQTKLALIHLAPAVYRTLNTVAPHNIQLSSQFTMIKTVRNLLSRSPDDSSDDDSIDWENPLAFYNIASRTINHEKNIEKGLHSEVAFYLYGALCFSLVPLTTYFMAPNPRFVKWYSANLAVKGSERFFDIAIPVLSVLCVSLVVMSVTSRTGDIELVLRNAIALLVWLFYFANLSNDILKDVALKSDIVRPDDSGALHLQPGYEQCQPFPTDLLNPTIVHELVLFVVVYIYFAFARFRQLMQIRNRRTILSNWSDLLRNVALNNGTAIIEEQDF